MKHWQHGMKYPWLDACLAVDLPGLLSMTDPAYVNTAEPLPVPTWDDLGAAWRATATGSAGSVPSSARLVSATPVGGSRRRTAASAPAAWRRSARGTASGRRGGMGSAPGVLRPRSRGVRCARRAWACPARRRGGSVPSSSRPAGARGAAGLVAVVSVGGRRAPPGAAVGESCDGIHRPHLSPAVQRRATLCGRCAESPDAIQQKTVPDGDGGRGSDDDGGVLLHAGGR